MSRVARLFRCLRIRRARRWTASELERIAQAAAVRAEELRWLSGDNT